VASGSPAKDFVDGNASGILQRPVTAPARGMAQLGNNSLLASAGFGGSGNLAPPQSRPGTAFLGLNSSIHSDIDESSFHWGQSRDWVQSDYSSYA